MDYTEERLERLHEVLLELFDYVREVCEQNGLPYLLIAGTTLGARRHGGFIPWDDDLDIALLRSDYEKLLSLLREAKHPQYTLQDENSERNYFLPFAKLRKNGTVFRESVAPDAYENMGIFLDIFPVDTTDDIQGLKFQLRARCINFIGHALRFKNCRAYYKTHRSKRKYFVDWLLSLPLLAVSNRKLLMWQKKLMEKDNSREMKFAVNFASTYSWKKEAMPAEIYFPVKPIDFEGRKCYAYADVDGYLRRIYGDFMKLPPEEKRHTHEPLELKF